MANPFKEKFDSLVKGITTLISGSSEAEPVKDEFTAKCEELDQKVAELKVAMKALAEKYGCKGNYVMGANIAGFEKVANAMMAQGIV